MLLLSKLWYVFGTNVEIIVYTRKSIQEYFLLWNFRYNDSIQVDMYCVWGSWYWYDFTFIQYWSFIHHDKSKYIPTNLWLSGLDSHWGRVAHICVGNLTIIGSDNGSLPGLHQAITWTNARLLLIGPLGTNLSEILFGIQSFSLKKMHFKCHLRNCVHFDSASMR